MTTPKEALELKPCPLCGGKFLMSREPHDNAPVGGMFYIYHDYGPLDSPARKCPIDVQKHFESEADAVVAWNTRATASIQGEDAVERVALPPIPDDDADFTPDLARKIIAKYQALLATGLVPDEAAVRADEREKCAPAVSRFEERIDKYVAQLNATGQADLAHLLRRDSDALLAAIRSGGTNER